MGTLERYLLHSAYSAQTIPLMTRLAKKDAGPAVLSLLPLKGRRRVSALETSELSRTLILPAAA